MKYGDTLRQRSIPEWAHHNIDYDYLKDLIKDQTTPGTGKALSIPGQGETIERAFGQTFFLVLKEQHNRINCFVKSKSGEIESRLDYIGKQQAQLRARSSSYGPDARLPARIVEQYAKIDADVTRAGEEIRSLSRFRTAQKTGFYKILKKYKRWTKDTNLAHRFEDEVCQKPDSFFQLDLGSLLDQYIDVLAAVRAPMGNSGPLTPFTGSSQGAAATLAQAIESGSDVEFDVALSTTPLGSRGNTAMYWIHVDHIVEVQVLLLQQLRLHSSRPGSSRASPHATPHRRISTATVDGYFGKEDDVGMIVLDQLEFFVPKQNASTVSASEGATGRTRAQAAGYVHWTGEEASVIVRGPEGGFGGLKTAIIKRKLVESFLDTPNSFADIPEAESYDANGKHGDSKKTGSVRQWLSGHKNIRPIAGLCSKRTRFVGLQNSSSGGIWATLDRDIAFKESVQTDLRSHEWASEARKGAHRFGHAVLEIRREGGYPESLIQQLDNSHLVQRVHGYSLETHAVWSCHKPAAMSPPVWISLLDQDLLKVPAPVKKRRRRQTATVPDTQSNSSRPDTSPSAASLTDGQSTPFTSRHDETPGTSASEMMNVPSLQAFRKKRRRPFAEYPPPIESEEPPQRQGYWNEYDNPESEDDGYYIYVDPDASMGFPGQEMFEGLARKAKRFFWRKNTSEQSPLLIAAEYPSSDDELETADEPAASNSRRHNYGAIDPVEGQRSQGGYWSSLFRSFRDPARDAETLDSLHRQSALERQNLMARLQVRQHQGEMAKLQTYISCLGAAVVLDIVLCVLAKTSRRKLRGEVDVAIILGTLCNLLLLLTAVVTIQTRHDHIGWIHQGTVYIMVIGMVVVDILLFRWALNL